MGVLGMGLIVSSRIDGSDDWDDLSDGAMTGRSAREKDSFRKAKVRARRVETEGDSRWRLLTEGWWLRSVCNEDRSVIVSRRWGWWMSVSMAREGELLIAAGGLAGWALLLRLLFFFFFGSSGGGGVISAHDESQSPMGVVTSCGCSAREASHSELCGDGKLSEESRP